MTASNQSSMHKCPVLPPTLSAPSNTWTLAFSFRSCSSFSVVVSAINLTDFIAPSPLLPPPPQQAIEADKIIWTGGGGDWDGGEEGTSIRIYTEEKAKVVDAA